MQRNRSHRGNAKGIPRRDSSRRPGHTELFFPDRGESLEEARAYCRPCPVREPCLDYALRFGDSEHNVGVWGGASGRDRRLARIRGWDARRLIEDLDARRASRAS
jgi:WhiB family redox-sensing transcriptional regulator